MSDNLKEVHSILQYLVTQPGAKDTFQGIAEWWIMREQINQSLANISQALDILVSKGFITVKEYRDQPSYYQLNEEMLEEIKIELNKLKEKKDLGN